jgi:hypothetical protein
MIFQMTMGASAAAMAARTRSLHDVDMQKQRELRLQMLRGAADVQDQLLDDDVGTVTSTLGRGVSSWRFWKTLLRRVVGSSIYPFARDVRQIEARFGYSVASYFRFFRWIILSFAAISLPSVVLLVLHILQLVDTVREDHSMRNSFMDTLTIFLSTCDRAARSMPTGSRLSASSRRTFCSPCTLARKQCDIRYATHSNARTSVQSE